ncbi:MAG: 16S rRNA (uracil(1498)-N(3))-methyltransferase [Lachnospiraceae bacterium]|nr:16S rRNA (uracil(1498)-N(3))-methyltransferase [Lachnospiraceae bacterium]
MYHFFVEPEQITGQEVIITGSDVNHIRNVLRMKAGEEVLVSDGEGLDRHCRITEITPDEIRCEVLDTEAARSESPVKFYLFQGLPKSDKFEQIIQKSVELGVYEIIPVETARSVVRYDDKKQKNKRERWQKIAESAAKQSNRGIIPEVKEVLRFDAALDYAADLDLILIPYENYKDMKATREVIGTIRPGMRVGIFIGPEGGFETDEVDRAMKAKAVPISLGNRILRTETAPLMLLSVLTFALEA